jgi:phosphomannomutase/phosphoglucomutase
MSIFKAYDIRGIFGKDLTLETVTKVGFGIASLLKEKKLPLVMAVGRDGRESSFPIFEALTKGLNAGGITVKDVGMVPTPLLYFAAYTQVSGNGIMITGSHNPPNYNGLKITIDHQPFFGESLKKLEQNLDQNKIPTSFVSQIENLNIKQAYIDRIQKDHRHTKRVKPLKIVVDAGNGVAGLIAPKLYRQLGYEVTELFCDVDASFPNHHPDPADPENLHDLIKAVKETQSDLGLAFDGDGDRLGIVTPSGEIIYPDRQMIIFIRNILAEQKGAPIIFDVKCSALVPAEIKKQGGKPVMYKTGHSWIKTHMKEISAPLGGEMSGHLFFAHRWYGFDDALYSGARLLEFLDTVPQAGKYLEELPQSFTTPEIKWEFQEEGQQHQLIQQLQSNLEAFKTIFSEYTDLTEAKISTIDGIRIDFSEGFGLIRASNTTPTIILRFEGISQINLSKIQELFRQVLSNKYPHLKLPF